MSRLEKACFSLPWTEKQCAAALAQPAFSAWGVWQNKVLLAYLSFYQSGPEAEILNLAVAPVARRQGLGKHLLQALLQGAAKMGIQKIALETRESNLPAITLYENCGFRTSGRRRRYYPDTGEDALIYTIDIQPFYAKRGHSMQKIIAGNWKMYKIRPEAAKTAATIAEKLAAGTPQNRLALIFPPYTDIATVADAFAGVTNLAVGGQNFYPAKEGAYTGEISPAMLMDSGAGWALVGHSERRHILNESDAFIAEKTAFGLEAGLKIMLCVGETLEEREAGKLAEVLERQLSTAIKPLLADNKSKLANLTIAYEPVWAIGTGKVAGPAEILEAHAQARKILAGLIGANASDMPILYGGSVKPSNAGGILGLDNVDGVLVGGASLEADSFLAICQA